MLKAVKILFISKIRFICMTLYDNENTRLSMFAFRSIMHVGWEKPNILTKCKQVLFH